MSEWFRRWFGEEYLRLYRHRDMDDAEAAVALIDRTLPVAGRRVLDLACGPGRHGRALAGLGATIVGLDLSRVMLTHARTPPALTVVRADMRALPFAPATFDIVVNLFTSFGFFEADTEHDGVIGGVAAALRPGGTLVLDYLNADQVRQTLVPQETVRLSGKLVHISRSVSGDGRFVEKRITPDDEDTAFLERVRLFSPADLRNLVRRAGLAVGRICGDYAGGDWHAGSPRAILFATKPT